MPRLVLHPLVSCAFVLFLGLAGCSDELTEIVVVVQTDASVPAEVNSIRLVVDGPSMQAFDETATLQGPSDLPLTLGLTPGDPDRLGPVRIVATGTGTGTIERVVETRFIEGKRLLLEIVLEAACQDVSICGDNTCIASAAGEAECASPAVDPSSLPEFSGAVPGAPDASSGADGAPDADPDAMECMPTPEDRCLCTEVSECPTGSGAGETPLSCTGGTCVYAPIRDHTVGENHMCSVFGNGYVYCLGGNSDGQLGTGDNTSSTSYRTVTAIQGNAQEVTAGRAHTCA
ncbi:MAG: hypothetical protein AAGF12_30305, partial [Myxococcota bacterium]